MMDVRTKFMLAKVKMTTQEPCMLVTQNALCEEATDGWALHTERSVWRVVELGRRALAVWRGCCLTAAVVHCPFRERTAVRGGAFARLLTILWSESHSLQKLASESTMT